MYTFLRREEDALVEEYFRNPQNIKHLIVMLKSMDALAYFAEVLHEYISMKGDLRRLIYSEDKVRRAGVKEHANKLDVWANELIGLLEVGNLREFAKANYEAYREAKDTKPKVGFFTLLKEMRSDEIKLTMGFLLLLLKKISELIENNGEQNA